MTSVSESCDGSNDPGDERRKKTPRDQEKDVVSDLIASGNSIMENEVIVVLFSLLANLSGPLSVRPRIILILSSLNLISPYVLCPPLISSMLQSAKLN